MAKKVIVQAKVETETLLALATSDTVTEAAERLGIQRNTLYDRIHKYGLTERLKDIQQAAQVELLTGAGKAARNLVDKIDHQDPNISVKSSTEVLDRIGVTKPTTTSSATINQFGTIVNDMKAKYDE